MVYDDSFSCALRGETLRVRGTTRYAFIAWAPAQAQGGAQRDEAGACIDDCTASDPPRTPFTDITDRPFRILARPQTGDARIVPIVRFPVDDTSTMPRIDGRHEGGAGKAIEDLESEIKCVVTLVSRGKRKRKRTALRD